jgi:hypothetical protein
MSERTPAERFAAHGLRLSEAEVAKLAEVIADVERISAWLRTESRSYLEEPVVAFHAAPRETTLISRG